MTDALLERLAASLGDRYRLEREIGRGGMATVYLARDVRHDRNVALKVLDPDLGAVLGAERFLSEIRVTANLQHPNLLPLFDSGATDGLLWYVMPYVEGETLRARLDRERQLPIDNAVHIAVAIAGALDYAHQHGVIHRDLKPENILLQHGEPVVADFGIALAISNAGGQRVTQTGLSLGTPLYMSPEQATGDRVIDSRSDIYSLGAVTYEMIAGEPPHTGSSSQAIIARLMTEVPRPLSTVRPTVPAHLEGVVQCALEKLPADRFSTAKEFADAMRDPARATRTQRHPPQTESTRRTRRILFGTIALLGVATVTLATLLLRSASQPPRGATRFVLDIPDDQQLAIANGSSVTLSPDGRTIAYYARARDGGNGIGQIYLRRLDSLSAHALPGGTGMAPIFSPDGKSIGFRAQTELRRMPITGGTPEVLATMLSWNGFGWGPANTALLAQGGSVWQVGSRGERTRLTTPDSAHGESFHAGPWMLNDDIFGFSIYRQKEGAQISTIGIASVRGGPHTDLDLAGDTPLGYIDGHMLVSGQGGTLVAVPVDLKKRKVTGPAIDLVDSVVWIFAGGLQLNLSPSGTLAYIKGNIGTRLTVLDSTGAKIAEAPEEREYRTPRLSPDGRYVVASVVSPGSNIRNRVLDDLWLWDIAGNALTRLTSTGASQATWLPDSKHVAFITRDPRSIAAVRGSPDYLIWSAPIDGSAAPSLIAHVPKLSIASFSLTASGRYAVFTVRGDTANPTDVYYAELPNDTLRPLPIANTRFSESAGLVSPDEHWIAYTSNESGASALYLRPFPGDGARIRVSGDGGSAADWSSNGKRLIYRQGRTQIAATLDFSGGQPKVVRRDTVRYEGLRNDINPRTGRVLVSRGGNDLKIIVVENWLAEAREKLRGNH